MTNEEQKELLKYVEGIPNPYIIEGYKPIKIVYEGQTLIFENYVDFGYWRLADGGNE